MKILGLIILIILNIFAFWVIFPIEIIIGAIMLIAFLINKRTIKNENNDKP